MQSFREFERIIHERLEIGLHGGVEACQTIARICEPVDTDGNGPPVAAIFAMCYVAHKLKKLRQHQRLGYLIEIVEQVMKPIVDDETKQFIDEHKEMAERLGFKG